jgi:hypothetical protein
MIKPSTVTTVCISLLGGGFAGAVFTWYVHRPSPAVVTYAITTTSTGADALTKGLVPNLTLKIGAEDIPIVYTHAVEFSTVRGDYLDSADVAITFPSALRIFGFSTAAPSDVHSIACKQNPLGLVCRIAPLSPGAKYRVNIAADNGQLPKVVTSSRNIDLFPLDAFLLSESRSLRAILLRRDFLLSTTAVILYFTAGVLYWKRRLGRRGRLLLVGKLVDHDGTPISGAAVRVNVDEPASRAYMYAPVVTDNDGDFIVGTVRKQPGLRGTVEVEHNQYATSTVPFRSPIILVTLDAKVPRPTLPDKIAPPSQPRS